MTKSDRVLAPGVSRPSSQSLQWVPTPAEIRYNVSLNLDGFVLRCDNVTHAEATKWVDDQLERMVTKWFNPTTLCQITLTPGMLPPTVSVP